MTNAIVKKLTNDETVRLNQQWQAAQVYHAAIRATDRLIKKNKFTKKRIMKVLMEEFNRQ